MAPACHAAAEPPGHRSRGSVPDRFELFGPVATGPFPNLDDSEATDVNDGGLIVGNSQVGQRTQVGPNGFEALQRAYSRAPAGPMVQLPTLNPAPHIRDAAVAVNNSGQIVGYSRSGTFNAGPRRAVLWQNGTVQGLGLLPTATESYATNISENGHVVGTSASSSVNFNHAFLWTSSSGMVDLGDLGQGLGGFAFSFGTDVNANGDVVGLASVVNDYGQTSHAFFREYPSGPMIDLGALGDVWSTPSDVNDNGLVVGTSSLWHDQPNHAFAWTAEAGMVDLGTLPGDTSSTAVAVNNDGLIVGVSEGPNGQRAVAWTLGAAEPDADNDGVSDSADNCAAVANADQTNLGRRRTWRRLRSRRRRTMAFSTATGRGRAPTQPVLRRTP